jgi:hypothetical protein
MQSIRGPKVNLERTNRFSRAVLSLIGASGLEVAPQLSVSKAAVSPVAVAAHIGKLRPTIIRQLESGFGITFF